MRHGYGGGYGKMYGGGGHGRGPMGHRPPPPPHHHRGGFRRRYHSGCLGCALPVLSALGIIATIITLLFV